MRLDLVAREETVKYLTYDWWLKGQEESPLLQYVRHLKQIRDRLPPDLRRLAEDARMPLHDGHLRELRLVASTRELQIVIDGDDGAGGACEFRLIYAGVRSLAAFGAEAGMPSPGGFGDLGYCEVDLVDDAYEHRMLFSTGIELHVVFEDFRLETKLDKSDEAAGCREARPSPAGPAAGENAPG